MLNINNVVSADAARKYYAAGDYYEHGQARDFIGDWHGRDAERLGLASVVHPLDFDRLLRNRHPATGKSLTGSTRGDRRAGVDFTFNAPKSVSVLYAATGDERIVAALRQAVRETMGNIEQTILARVRRGKASHDRVTGSFAWAEFVQFTTRPTREREDPRVRVHAEKLTPDPHLHIHAVAPNLTWDDVEGKWKALQLEEYGKGGDWSERPRFQAEFHARLAEQLRRIGYGVRRSEHAFEVAGVPERALQEFSRRREEIDALAEELAITTGKGREKLARTSRRRKDATIGWERLRKSWLARLRPEELAVLHELHRRSLEAPVPEFQAAPAVDWALEHLLERRSVVPERELLTRSLLHGLGAATADGVAAEIRGRDLLRAEIGGRRMVSTREVMREEFATLAFARERRGKLAPLNEHGTQQDERLSGEQRRAVWHVWNSRDPLIVVRGQAGTGKTTMMREAIAGLARAGHPVVVLAPTAEAARGVLRREGFEDSTTVAEFLVNEKLRRRAERGVIWVDEAGLLGFRDMHRLVTHAKELGARLVLSGDRAQHRSVARGEPLALLEDLAGLPVAELREIRRQKGAYRAAVEKLAKGRLAEGLEALEAMGAVALMPARDKYQPLAEEYIQGLKNDQDMLVLSPTHAEGEAITEVLRERLKQEAVLGSEEREFPRLVPLHLTRAERGDPAAIAGATAVFVRHAGTHRAGDRVEITPELAASLAETPDAFAAYRRDTIHIAPGERLRITANGRDRSGQHRLHNGSLYRVRGFSKGGDVVLENGWVLGKEFGLWQGGYALTSYGGQGKTVDRVLLAVSAQSLPAANMRQLYVDASRGREGLTIYTDDRARLREACLREERRLHAVDLVGRPKARPGSPWRRAFARYAERFRRWQEQAQRFVRPPEQERAAGLAIGR
jgi:conjugative relaxase-like TrwC/TraI family protein